MFTEGFTATPNRWTRCRQAVVAWLLERVRAVWARHQWLLATNHAYAATIAAGAAALTRQRTVLDLLVAGCAVAFAVADAIRRPHTG